MSRIELNLSGANDVSPSDTFERLKSNPNAILIDVRTEAEWDYVGWPSVDRLVNIAWQHYPDLTLNEEFLSEVEELDPGKDKDLYIICRSGVRSAHAVHTLMRAGFKSCYNVAEGFEGDLNSDGHRGVAGGWKRAGLPWRQN